MVNGSDLGSASPKAYNLVNPDTLDVLIKPSAISAETAFTDTLKHSS